MSTYPPPNLYTPMVFNEISYVAPLSSSQTSYLNSKYLKKVGGETVTNVETFSGGIKTDTVKDVAGNSLLTKTGLGANIVSSSLTSLGNLSSLTVTGDLTVDSSVLKVDSTNNRVGVNKTPAAGYDLDVNGGMKAGKSYFGSSSTSDANNIVGETKIYYNTYSDPRSGVAQAVKITGGLSSDSLYAPQLIINGGVSVGHSGAVGQSIGLSSYTGGPYIRTKEWDTAGTSHTINISDFAYNGANENFCGRLTVYAAYKTSVVNTSKVGVLVCDVFKIYGSLTQIVKISNNSKGGFTTFDVSVNGSDNNIYVSTDTNTRICWFYTGAL